VFPTLKNAAINSFISRFVDGPGGDRVGLVSFASGAVIDVPINKNATRGFNRTQIVNAINSLTAVGATATAEGMAKGFAELQAIPVDVRSSLRVILLFSDGAPNMVNGQFWRGTASAANRLLPSSGTINLYSETGSGSITSPGRCLSSDGACRTMPSNLRNGPETFYSNDYASSSPNNPRISHLPLTGSGGVPLASFDNRRTLTTATGATGFPYANNRCNVNKAARNMVERIANDARNNDIRVYTIGLGNALNTLEVSFCSYTVSNESGASILRRVANAADSDALNVNQPRGLYCYAADASELNRCFSSIASEILRLTI
jgi:hypothetical protein